MAGWKEGGAKIKACEFVISIQAEGSADGSEESYSLRQK